MPPRSLTFIAAALAVAVTAGCAGRGLLNASPTAAGFIELTSTPFHPQEIRRCGPAALATVLGAAGLDVTPASLADAVYLPEKEGSLQIELIAATRRHGYLPYTIRPQLDDLLAQLEQGRPVLVLQNLGVPSWPLWHYAVVIGFDRAEDEIILRSGRTERLVMSARRFLRTWRWADYWGVLVLPPGELPADGDADSYLRAVANAEAFLSPHERRESYEAALHAWPDAPLALLGLGNAHYALGDLVQAEASYRALAGRQPQDPIARNNLAQVLAEQGRFEQAREQLDRAMEHVVADGPLYEQIRHTRAEIEALANARDR